MEALKLDLEEVKKLEEAATRPRILNTLTRLKKEIEDDLAKFDMQKTSPKKSNSDASVPKIFTTTITSYGWDQSDKFVKIYVSNLNGVQSIPTENVTVSYTEAGHYKLFISDLNGKNYQLILPKLLKSVSSTTVKVKTDMVVIMLKKEVAENWSNLSAKDKDAQDKKNEKMKAPPPAADKDADPSKGIMDLMKKMYDEGDDDMKRTIAKAWTESRSKQGMPPM